MTPTFQFFEDICNELAFDDGVVLPDDTFLSPQLLSDLQDEHKELDPERAVPRALVSLQDHFQNRQSALPFQCDLTTRTYNAVDSDFIEFVSNASSIRGVRTESRNFEVETASRLARRGIGTFHRVGWPRNTRGKKKDFNDYLNPLGFNDVLVGSEKDGGFDILWLLPFGAIPHRPIFTFQCKNGSYDLENAFQSNGMTNMSLNSHRGLSAMAHTICVVFNDYIEAKMLSPKPYDFVPLGLSDLAALVNPPTTVAVL